MVEFFIEIDIVGTDIQLHEACGPAVIHYSLARKKTIPEKDRKSYLKQWVLL